MSESQPRSFLKPDVDGYAGVDIVEPRGVAAVAAFLRSRPSSDLALVGALLSNGYVGAHAKQLACTLVALGVPLLLWLLTVFREERHRAAQTRPHQPRDQPDG